MWNETHPFSNIYITAAIAIIPLLWIFLSMLKFKLSAFKASLVALIISALIAFMVFKMPFHFIGQATLEGMTLGLWPILFVIFAAIFTYNLSVKSGAMGKIKTMLSNISPDRRVQVLILAFAFGGFLEAAAGFGTAVAIPAGILAAMGFEPVFAAVICLVANTIPVAFGAVGIPVITLANLTGLSLHTLTLYIALQLLPFVLILPAFIVILTTGSIKGLRGVIGITAASGIAFGVVQTLVAMMVGPELAAIAGSISSLGVLVFWAKLFPVKQPWSFKGEIIKDTIKYKSIKLKEGLLAWLPYILILVLILMSRLPILNFLNFNFKYQIYSGPGGKPMSFSLASNPGILILLAAILGGVIQKVYLKDMMGIAGKTFKQISKTIITVLSIVSLAKVMGFSGMISSIAQAFSSLTGPFFPLISPLLGALGTFITGSDTSSNVLFGELQKQTAIQIGSNYNWITAANASGATAGKMISPQSIAIATSATGLSGFEGKILARTIKYSLAFVIFMGVLVYVVNLVI